MIWSVISIHDTASKTYLPPFNVRHIGEAKRHFAGSVNGGDNLIAQNPGDFTLFRIGRYDDETGVLEPLEHENLGNGVVFLKKPG